MQIPNSGETVERASAGEAPIHSRVYAVRQCIEHSKPYEGLTRGAMHDARPDPKDSLYPNRRRKNEVGSALPVPIPFARTLSTGCGVDTYQNPMELLMDDYKREQRIISQLLNAMQLLRWSSERLIECDLARFEEYLAQAEVSSEFESFLPDFEDSVDPFSKQELDGNGVLSMLLDKKKQIQMQLCVVENLRSNAFRIFANIQYYPDEIAPPFSDGCSYLGLDSHETIELVITDRWMDTRYDALQRLLEARLNVQNLHISLFSRHQVFLSDYLPHLANYQQSIKLPDDVRCTEPNISFSDIDQLIVSAIHVTALSFPITSGAVPESVYSHPYARGHHPLHSVVVESCLRALGDSASKERAKGRHDSEPQPVIGSSYMGLINCFFLSIMKEAGGFTPESAAPLKVAFFPKKPYFEVDALIDLSLSIGRRMVSKINGKLVDQSDAQIIYFDAVRNAPDAELHQCDDEFKRIKDLKNIKIIIVDATLDPFLETFPSGLVPAPHQTVIVLTSLTKFAQAGILTVS